jgi:hypothetical protein
MVISIGSQIDGWDVALSPSLDVILSKAKDLASYSR